MGGTPHFNHGHPPAFESHDPASMGKVRIPGNKIMLAPMAGRVHENLILVDGYWKYIPCQASGFS
jgi:hypothetical protein